MSLKKNVLASYASQAYVTLVGILTIPIYLKQMGPEAYGLIGFFAVMQSLFQLLDMGLTPTMSRETARYLGGVSTAEDVRRLIRALEGVFLGVAIAGSSSVAFSANLIATKWLNISDLPPNQVVTSIMLMGLIVGLRWIAGLYRGVISGFERLVWLSAFNAITATTRFVFVIPFLQYFGSDPIDFFGYQIVVAFFELTVLIILAYRILPPARIGLSGLWNWRPISSVLKFSVSIAFTSSIWILVTQADKLLLSKILPLSDYAFFSMAVVMAGGVFLVSGPISSVLLPRMTRLNAEGKNENILQVYRQATQFISLTAMSAALVLAFFSQQILWAWTGDLNISRTAAPILSLYALGNGFLTLSAFPYYLQFAKGDMRLHIWGNIFFILILIPSLILATINYGAIGAGYAWLIVNLIYFLTWVPIVHHRFASGMHNKWLVKDIGRCFFLSTITLILLHNWVVFFNSRLYVGIQIVSIGMVVLIVSSLSVESIRTKFMVRFFKKLN